MFEKHLLLLLGITNFCRLVCAAGDMETMHVIVHHQVHHQDALISTLRDWSGSAKVFSITDAWHWHADTEGWKHLTLVDSQCPVHDSQPGITDVWPLVLSHFKILFSRHFCPKQHAFGKAGSASWCSNWGFKAIDRGPNVEITLLTSGFELPTFCSPVQRPKSLSHTFPSKGIHTNYRGSYKSLKVTFRRLGSGRGWCLLFPHPEWFTWKREPVRDCFKGTPDRGLGFQPKSSLYIQSDFYFPQL